jgi:hypothetical protein
LINSHHHHHHHHQKQQQQPASIMNAQEYDKVGRLSVEDEQMMGSPYVMPKEVRSITISSMIPFFGRPRISREHPKNLAPNRSSMQP